MNKRICVLVLVFALVALALTAPVAGAAKRGNNPGVIPPPATPAGMTYGEWGAAFWQWAFAIPKDQNPLNDETGANAANGQHGRVWFLAGTTNSSPSPDNPTVYIGKVDRHVTIPAGKLIFFPIVNVEASIAEGDGVDEQSLKAKADWYISHVRDLAVTVDGRPLRNLAAYRAQSPLYSLWWPEDPVLDYLAALTTPTDSIADGYWIMLAPLPVGRHVLHWEGNMTFTADADGFDGVFAQDITYHVRVK